MQIQARLQLMNTIIRSKIRCLGSDTHCPRCHQDIEPGDTIQAHYLFCPRQNDWTMPQDDCPAVASILNTLREKGTLTL